MTDALQDLMARAIRFRDERDWAQFHRPKDLALGVTIEAAELAELFLWKGDAEVREMLEDEAARGRVADELSDVLVFLLYIAHACQIDLGQATLAKIEKNAIKYPVEKARGTARKYTEL